MKILFSCTGIPTAVEDGDVIIVKKDYSFYFYYVTNSSCNLIEIAKTIKFMRGDIKDGVAFDYSDLMPRKGNIEQLLFFISVFKSQTTVDVLQNALDILLYKEDKWRVTYLQSLALQEPLQDKQFNKNAFVDFLSEKAKEYFYKQTKNGASLSESFRSTKKMYAKDFALALRKYKTAFPEKSIYDT